MTIALQPKVMYGPLKSRRFGRSLGVNLLPTQAKICNFDCVYCQYGASSKEDNIHFPSLEEIQVAARAHFSFVSEQNLSIDWITIAGNGEPTLHPQFEEAVRLLKSLRDRLIPGVPIGILSNASTCHRPEIRRALLELDECFMKLDAGTRDIFEAVNEPRSRDGWEEMIEGLKQLPSVTLQSLFVKGAASNLSADSVGRWIDLVEKIRPLHVQIYTIDRPTRNEDCLPATIEELNNIKMKLWERTKIPGFVYN